MHINDHEKELINNYIPTLKRNFNKKINYKYFKSPFIEKYIYKMICLSDDTKLISKIVDEINNDIISNEDILFLINYYYNFNKNSKIKIQNFLYKNNENDIIILKLKINLVLFLVKYYQFYFIINELLFDVNDKKDDSELFYSIYLYLKNNNNKENISKYSKKYFNMKIFFHLIEDLFTIYKKNMDILIKNELIDTTDYISVFIKNIFSNWNFNYKKYIEEKSFENIQKQYELKENILLKFICQNNLC